MLSFSAIDETRRLLRGRTPELYTPIRAALIDALRFERENFYDVVRQLRSQATLWLLELEPKRLFSELKKTRQADFFLQRLIEFMDVNNLLGKMLEAIARQSQLDRVLSVQRLYASYDRLLVGAGDDKEITGRPLK